MAGWQEIKLAELYDTIMTLEKQGVLKWAIRMINGGREMPRWEIGLPDGPSGPFYSAILENGKIVALQIPDKNVARTIVKLGKILDYDFYTVEKAGSRLRQIFARDNYTGDPGAESFIIRAVIEALFEDSEK